MSHSSTQTTASQKRQQRWIAALVALGLTIAGVVAQTAAAHAATELTTYVSDANGGTSQVNATVLTPSSTFLSADWYVCNSTMTISSQVTINGASAVQIILGDSCNLTINGVAASGGTGILVPANSVLRFYGQVNNTGRLNAFGYMGVGIGNVNALNGVIIFNGGSSTVVSFASEGSHAYPGIGTSSMTGIGAPNPIAILWNASVYAQGSDGNANIAGAPGIGTGTSDNNQSTVLAGSIAIDTTGIVQAVPGALGYFSQPPGIGKGPWAGGTGSTTIPTYTVAKNASGPGTMNMRTWTDLLTTSTPFLNVAAGSNVTFVATPTTDAKLRTVDAGLNFVSTDGLSSTYRLLVNSINTATPKTAYFWYPTTSTVTTTPTNTQTHPGNVTINGSITHDLTDALIGSNGQAQLWINGVLAQTQNVTSGEVTFTHTSPLPGTYSYQIKYLGVTDSPFLATSESAPLTGFEVLGAPQNPLAINGINTTGYTYGDAPIPVTVTGGSGTGAYELTSSNPTLASLGTITNGASTLTINQAGTFTLTGTRAGDATYAEATVTTPTITVLAATPAATLTRTGGDTVTTPVDATMTVNARGTGATPQGLVQFSLNNQKLGDPLPLVDNGDGTASVSLTGIPIAGTLSQAVEATYLDQTGKYTTVTKTSTWYLGVNGFCLADPPPET
ncbi:hypothetical protein QBL02_03265 [Leucobacter sp. UT-8R-CII-1-4]|uniref:hypothetical protein n=1 Tax=Leucobacter sp. UT-8R-CII-1-4 TaxID=3040075 RepID=UPI0024A7FD75|nr:hypothetical protein [Leucobacter sp. UT-8R-CII-1-4]MDI6022560.1 hypothetical protein [Leucobacter sp. UT-8R-CII-1-4]